MSIDLSPHSADLDLLRSRAAGTPTVALVLGSGLGGVADSLADRVEVPYGDLLGMNAPGRPPGHAGVLAVGDVGATRVMCFMGRVHMYQGVSAYEASYPARLASAMGAETLIVTNAAGSLRPGLPPGEIMLITDHINLIGDNPLTGWPGPQGGDPFVPMGQAYDRELANDARSEAARLGIKLSEGVYAALRGPSFETPAEVGYLRTAGADAVGMSTVPEVICARALGMRVLGLSSITNFAGGEALSHEDVLEAGETAAARLSSLLSAILAVLRTA